MDTVICGNLVGVELLSWLLLGGRGVCVCVWGGGGVWVCVCLQWKGTSLGKENSKKSHCEL